MKLRVYEDLPATPIPSESQLSQWGKTLASRASSRASRISMKRRTTSKSSISKPLPLLETGDDLPLRRGRKFSPIQLSICESANRLSDLPEFDQLSFTDLGELRRPTKALMRTQSEDMLRKHQMPTITPPKRTMSMFEAADFTFATPETTHSIISTSRPPSEYDALHSHPVSCVSLPGLSACKSQKSDNYVDVLTPMQEEFSPIATAVTVDGTVLTFPMSMRPKPATVDSDMLPLVPEAQAPYPVVCKGPSDATSKPRRTSVRPSMISQQNHKRVSQWLHYRSHSNSTNTIGTTSTSSSFAEHRRKRSEFYKLGHLTQAPPMTTVSPPQPLNYSRALPTHQHQRTDTNSTLDTVSTSVMSTVFDGETQRRSEESMTVYSAESRSRTGTIKSLSSPYGLRIITPEQQNMPLPSALSAQIVNPTGLYLSEINGPLRSPGVGVAF